MTFRLLHTSDWHIGKPFGRFDDELAPQLRRARLNAIDRIAAHARDQSITHVLVAGDVFDHADPATRDIAAVLERLATSAPVRWWLLPGNHDPASAHGVWWRITNTASLTIPENVTLLLNPEPAELESGVVLLPTPLHSKNPGRDVTAWMDGYATSDDVIRIGLAHGPMHGFGDVDDGDGSAPASVIAQTRAETAKLDYFALGDWHGQKEISPRTWYSGTPEPDRFRHNEPGGCLVVEISAAGAPITVTRNETSEFAWRKLEADVRSENDLEDIFANLALPSHRAQNTLVQLQLSGELSPVHHHRLALLHAQYSATLAYLDVRSDGLSTLVTDGDLDMLDHGGALRVAGETLARQSRDTGLEPQQRDAARRALQLLFTFANQAGGEGAR